MKIELNPCPFCGEVENLVVWHTDVADVRVLFVRCCACGAEGPEVWSTAAIDDARTFRDAADRWNRRAP